MLRGYELRLVGVSLPCRRPDALPRDRLVHLAGDRSGQLRSVRQRLSLRHHVLVLGVSLRRPGALALWRRVRGPRLGSVELRQLRQHVRARSRM